MAALLWGGNTDERAAANLRQAIWRIRSIFDGAPPLLEADSDTVWIRQDAIARILPSTEQDSELLEGICLDEEAFEDWLRRKRTKQTSPERPRLAEMCRPLPLAYPPNGLPKVAIYPAISLSETEQSSADLVIDIVIKTLLEQGCVEVFDLRNVHSTPFDSSRGEPTFALIPRMVEVDGNFNFSITMRNVFTGQVLWTRWLEDCMCAGHQMAHEFLLARVGQISNEVHDQLFHLSRTPRTSGLFSAVQDVLTHSKEGQIRARFWLTDAAEDSGVARAWLMYTFAVDHAERYGGLDPSALDELKHHCHCAEESAPANPIVRAIIGHVNAFVFRNFEEADYHHEIARKTGWNHPVVWTLSAMHANYINQPDKAHLYSSRALAQSAFSPNRFYFEGPHSISCSLTNRHREAISISSRILAKKPGFLAVMRHLAASQAIAGHLDEARATIAAIRTKDPQFSRNEISASDYPLPSMKSVQLIKYALEVVGS